MIEICKLSRSYYDVKVYLGSCNDIEIDDGGDKIKLSIEELEKIIFLAKLKVYTEKGD